MQLLCRYRGIYIFYNKFFILTLGLGLAASASWVNIINLFFKFAYVFLCFKMKCYSSSSKSVCMIVEEILFISLLIVTEFLGLELIVVILSTIQIKSAVSCTAEVLRLTELLVLSFVIGFWTSGKAFAVSKTFPGNWREILTVFPFLARSCVSRETSVLVVPVLVICLFKFEWMNYLVQ